MISYIKGSLTEQKENSIVVECQGIGYQILTPKLESLEEKIGDIVKVYTYLQVREDACCLYGFLSREEREVFMLLIKVNGIGPKAALAILSTLTLKELAYAILSEDEKTISKAPGIGAKGAKRLILDLKDKLKIEDLLEEGKDDKEAAVADEDAKYIAIQGLLSLGYSNAEAIRAVRSVSDSEGMNAEQLLKAALKQFI